MKTPSFHRRGAALIVVLSIIILVTILVVGMTLAMRMERSASHFHLERLRAEMFARSGVDRGLALLNAATATNRFWVSSPGRIVASDPGTFRPLTTNYILSSGFTNSTDSNVVTDLNRPAWNAGDRLLNPGGTNMAVRWIYVLKDGSTSDVLNTNTSNPNPAVGRFAYWVDDDSTRVNVNTAAARLGNNYTLASPSQVSLSAVSGTANIGAVTNFALTNTFLSAMQAVELVPSLTNARFDLTAHAQSPEVDPWGRPRMVLTTKLGRTTNGAPYFDILTSESDPGLVGNIDPTKLQTVYTNIVASLGRTDWPFGGTGSLETKFGTASAQLALDIVEYVRTTESSLPWVEPLVVTPAPGTLAVSPTNTALDAVPNTALIGTVRRPMVSQVALFCSTNVIPLAGGHEGKLYIELFFPTGYRVDPAVANLTVTNAYIHAQIESSEGGIPQTVSGPVGNVVFNGEYALISTNVTVPGSGAPGTNFVRVALLDEPAAEISNILDIAPLGATTRIELPAGTNTTGTAWLKDLDPRLNKIATYWTNGSASEEVSPVPKPILTNNFPSYPHSDQATNSVYFPTTNSVVGSVGELGFVFSGAPWRSIRLRPGSSANTNQVPDWAMLELFAAPIDNPAIRLPFYLPAANVVAGRVNVNAAINLGTTNWSRSNSLNALFTNTAVSNSVETAVSNVIGVTNFTGLNFSGTNAILLSVGQLAEISGVMTNSELGELSMRQLASLATVRSGVFTVYSMGQALQVSPGGKVSINGEKMVKATVERYYTSSGEVKFRTIAWSEIYP